MWYPQYRLAGVLLAGSVLVLGACDDDDETNPQQFATVRFVNASSATAAAVTPQVSGQAFGTAGNITGFQSSSQCVQVPVTGSAQPITFQSGGQNITLQNAATFNFQPNQRYTVILHGSQANARNAIVLTDPAGTFQAPTDQNAVRFVNVFGQTGSIFVTTPTGNVGTTADVANLASGQASTGGLTNTGFFGFPTANTFARFFTGATTGNPQAQFTLTNASLSNRLGTVVFTPAATTGGATGFAFAPCP